MKIFVIISCIFAGLFIAGAIIMLAADKLFPTGVVVFMIGLLGTSLSICFGICDAAEGNSDNEYNKN